MNYKYTVDQKLKLIDKFINICKINNLNCIHKLCELKENYFLNKDTVDYLDILYSFSVVFTEFEKQYIGTVYDYTYYSKCRLFCSIIAGNGGDDANDLSKDIFLLYRSYFSKYNCVVDFCVNKLFIEINNYYVYCKMLFLDNKIYKIIRISPFTNKKQTSFVKVHFYETYEEILNRDFKDNEIIFTCSKSSGAGGQHVNKTESKVQVTHLLSGISVVCADTRSQLKNRELAVIKLRDKINSSNQIKLAIEKQENYAHCFKISWFNFDRIINLHKEHFIKDNSINMKLKVKSIASINLTKIYESYFLFLLDNKD